MQQMRMHFVDCAQLSLLKPTAALELIATLKACGGTLNITDISARPEEKPERKIDSTGSIIGGIGLEHALLGGPARTIGSQGRRSSSLARGVFRIFTRTL